MKARSSGGYRDALTISDSEETERLQMEVALRASRNEIQNFDSDLQRSLIQSLVEYSDVVGSDASAVASAVDIEDDILRSVAEESEREYIERQIAYSIPDAEEVGDSRGHHNYALGTASLSSSCSAQARVCDEEVERALQLSALSEEDAFELALQMSMSTGPVGPSSRGAVNFNSSSASSSSSSAVQPPRDADPLLIDEDADLQAALTESLMSSYKK
jgi:hypothetical protein